MALLNHNSEKEKQKKKLLNRGPKVEVSNKVNRNDLDSYDQKKFRKMKEPEITTVVTEPVNIRVDNHIRNNISSLITMGFAESQKEMVDIMVDMYVETLEESEYKRYLDLVQIYEDKDVRRANKRKGN
ncbi:DUF5388 domain-containing protein [Marinilactibacillus kalidii]|uniref:DUF5388 domain-containing protein n=1 Tax=Marinilactibacillus kalidii TaxID=2820274 RepID=UPI001ABE20FC|nr:DUF5388 domain-containing protein [Marinilactibacillus kalidii]